MRATIHLFGLELLSIELTTDDTDEVKAYGDVVSTATAEAGPLPSRDGYEDRAGFR